MTIKHIGNFLYGCSVRLKGRGGRSAYFYHPVVTLKGSADPVWIRTGQVSYVKKEKRIVTDILIILPEGTNYDTEIFQSLTNYFTDRKRDFENLKPSRAYIGLYYFVRTDYSKGEDLRKFRLLIPDRAIGKLDGNYYTFSNKIYRSSVDYELEEAELLVKAYEYKRKSKFENLEKQIKLFEKMEAMEIQWSREPIPEEVRFAVWRRDKGKCVKCGSKKKLEFDHIIPASKGGSSTERNIQLLCEKCNREKSDKI